MPDKTYSLKPRTGPAPRTTKGLPHAQLDQWPSASITQELLRRVLELPGAGVKESRVASPSVRAIKLSDEDGQGPRQAFIDDHEFCHLHPPPDGSIHLTLPDAVCRRAAEAGWVEPHLLAKGGGISKSTVLVYAPRDSDELETVVKLIETSYLFARGLQGEHQEL